MAKNPAIHADNLQNQEPTPIFTKHIAILFAAIKSLLRNPVRSSIVLLCLVAILSPFATAIAICEGIKAQYASILKKSGDIYVARDNYGINAPIELDMIDRFMRLQGVTKVVPRVIGRTYVKGKLLVVFGIPPTSIPSHIRIIEGRKPKGRGEVILGQGAAKYLNVGLGTRFSIERNPNQVFKIVGLFDSPINIWNVDLLVMNFQDASDLFGIRDKATDLIIYTRPGYEQIVDIIIHMSQSDEGGERPLLRVQTKDLIDRYTRRGFNMQAGVFTAFYAIVFALAIPAIGVISGFGLSERRREVGVMKALGWQTQEVLRMVALENLILSIISVPLIILVAAGWIHLLNGAGMAHFFMPALDILVPFSMPSRIFPIPLVLSIMMALILTMVGSIYPTWRTAIVPPSEAMKT
jgi:ABC-type lipoprotein release transport system permease subunit